MPSTARSAGTGATGCPVPSSASMRWMTVSCAIRRIQNPTVWSGAYHEPAGSVGLREANSARRPGLGLGALAHGQGLVQVHLADVAGQVGDGPARTGRHRRAGFGRHDGPQADEVGREAVEESGVLHAEQFSTCSRPARPGSHLAPNSRIWAPDCRAMHMADLTPNGGSARVNQEQDQSQQVTFSLGDHAIRSPIIRFGLADASRWWRRADHLFGGGGRQSAPQAGAVSPSYLLLLRVRELQPGSGMSAAGLPASARRHAGAAIPTAIMARRAGP